MLLAVLAQAVHVLTSKLALVFIRQNRRIVAVQAELAERQKPVDAVAPL
jgi:hypothetical protein